MLQGPLREALTKSGVWPAWEPEWRSQQTRTFKYTEGRVQGGTRVMSVEYGKSKTRNGTRVEVQLVVEGVGEQACAGEVLRLVWLRPSGWVRGDNGGSSSSSGGAGHQQGGSLRVVQFAIVQPFDTKVRRDHPEIAVELLEAKLDSLQDRMCAVPLDQLHPLNACHVHRDGVSWLQFVRQIGRSNRHFFGLPC
jgi:hypothetical protein